MTFSFGAEATSFAISFALDGYDTASVSGSWPDASDMRTVEYDSTVDCKQSAVSEFTWGDGYPAVALVFNDDRLPSWARTTQSLKQAFASRAALGEGLWLAMQNAYTAAPCAAEAPNYVHMVAIAIKADGIGYSSFSVGIPCLEWGYMMGIDSPGLMSSSDWPDWQNYWTFECGSTGTPPGTVPTPDPVVYNVSGSSTVMECKEHSENFICTDVFKTVSDMAGTAGSSDIHFTAAQTMAGISISYQAPPAIPGQWYFREGACSACSPDGTYYVTESAVWYAECVFDWLDSKTNDVSGGGYTLRVKRLQWNGWCKWQAVLVGGVKAGENLGTGLNISLLVWKDNEWWCIPIGRVRLARESVALQLWPNMPKGGDGKCSMLTIGYIPGATQYNTSAGAVSSLNDSLVTNYRPYLSTEDPCPREETDQQSTPVKILEDIRDNLAAGTLGGDGLTRGDLEDYSDYREYMGYDLVPVDQYTVIGNAVYDAIEQLSDEGKLADGHDALTEEDLFEGGEGGYASVPSPESGTTGTAPALGAGDLDTSVSNALSLSGGEYEPEHLIIALSEETEFDFWLPFAGGGEGELGDYAAWMTSVIDSLMKLLCVLVVIVHGYRRLRAALEWGVS